MLANPINLESGLVGHWQMEDGTGSAAAVDSSANGNDGTLTNMDINTDWVAGRVGDGALDFDGTDDRVSMGVLGIDVTDSFTYSVWVYLDRWTDPAEACGNKRQQIFGHMHTPWGGQKLQTSGDNGNQLLFNASADNETVWYEIDDANAVSLSQWHHIVALHDGTTRVLRMYVDGHCQRIVC